jgi:2-polyprenyl-3-methyl-5-hydroxy-6-metoxy-1,4-benzoquinol methylase/Tfp pilus assembly protein PilF
MADLERTPSIPAAAAPDEAPPAGARSVAAGMIAEGNALSNQGRMAEAMARYDAAVQADPQCAPAHLNRGNVLLASAQFDAARSAYQQAIACDPRYAAAHFNLGNLSYRAGEFAHALRSYQAAVGIRPQFADACVGMANALVSLGRTAEAMASYQHALTIDPGHAEAHFNLATILQHRGQYPEALQLLARALERAPNWKTKVAFAQCAARTRFTTDDSLVRAALTTAITEAWTTPDTLCRSALTLIMLDERIASCVHRADESWPARPPRAALFGAGGLAALAADPLLHAVLDAAPVNSIHFERFLTCARSALLDIASSEQPPDAADVTALEFYAALARQCFVNEFVFDYTDSERLAAAACRGTLLALLDANAGVPRLLLLAVAAYFPLHRLPRADRLLAASEPGPVDEVLRQQVREPFTEQTLRSGIACLTPIAGGVSQVVREQYEQNPFPRWVSLPRREQALHFNTELHRIVPFARFSPMADDSAPEVLIAGCGTGSEAILAAQRFSGVRVLAVDLSLGSISYAKRKTQELGLTNIEYAQADILELGGLARTFDIIGSVGVLHHLADPFEGWRILLSRLRPGGFMRLGLYSQIARRSVVEARKLIAARGYASTPEGIRRFRQDVLAEDTAVELRALSQSRAFYSMSDCRDMAFHVQEQHLTLGQIESFLTGFELRFLGFELDLQVLNQYRARFGDDPYCTDLRHWAHFEADNPETFTAMYRFWIQR